MNLTAAASIFCRLRLWLTLAAVAALAGCSRHQTRVQIGDETQVLHLGNMTEPNDLDPAYPNSDQTVQIILALMEGLAQFDPKTCEPLPAGAERWEESADHLSWTFHLRPTALWSNGDPVTAQDYVYAYRRMLSPMLAAEYANSLFCLRHGEDYYLGRVKDFGQVGAEAADPHTLILHLEHPVPYLLSLLCLPYWYPVHPATIEKFGKIDQRGTPWTRPGNYVGNGPFILAEWRPNQIIRVTPAPTYWNRRAIRLHEVDFYPVEDNVAEEAMFRDGQLHITATIPISKIAVYHDNPKLAPLLRQDPWLSTYFYRFNVRVPPLNDVRVRRALAYAIDRQEIVDHVARGGQDPAEHLAPDMPDGFSARAKVPFDLTRARQLLAEAGFPDGKGFPHLEILYNTNDGHRQIAEAIQQMWRRNLGVDIGLENQEAKVYIDNMREGRYQIGRYGWVADYPDPSTFYQIMTSNDGNNETGWSDPEYDRLVEASHHAATNAERFALFQRCEQILADECPLAYIYFYKRNNLRLPDVKGWYGNPLDIHPFTGVYLEAPPAAAAP
jgi:oligopeptide transport system substrate-binding protein